MIRLLATSTLALGLVLGCGGSGKPRGMTGGDTGTGGSSEDTGGSGGVKPSGMGGSTGGSPGTGGAATGGASGGDTGGAGGMSTMSDAAMSIDSGPDAMSVAGDGGVMLGGEV